MDLLRTFMIAVSALLHAGAGWYVFAADTSNAYAVGSGDDMFVVEQGFTIEGAAAFGQDIETVQAQEAEPQDVSEARPEVEEVKAKEVEEETKVISSEEGPVQEVPPEEVKVAEPQQQQVATIEQQQVIQEEAKQAASLTQTGGDASARAAYKGKLFAHISRKIVKPRPGVRTGEVLVRFTIMPTGEVVSREVAKSSGHKNIDDAALATIDRASPFPAAPSEIAATGPMVHTVPFIYRVE